MNDSCPSDQSLTAMLNGQLGEDASSKLVEHVSNCEACQRRYDSLALKLAPVADGGSGESPELIRVTKDLLARHTVEYIEATLDSKPVPSDDDRIDLSFLESSDRADSLGRLGKYEIDGVIGQGGMGVVLKGFDIGLDRKVAIKILGPALASNATAKRRFMREAKAAAAVSHDHVVTIYAIDEAAGQPFIVMELIDGVSLQTRIDRTGPLQLEEILRIGLQMAAGLAAAHAQGLVHRDIKPGNILLENGVERVKITDFGLARACDDVQITETGSVSGTPAYMSPEQAEGKSADHRSDLFSLGCVLYATCTGRSPFRASTLIGAIRRVCDDTPRPICEINPEIPQWVSDVIDRLLQKDPDSRPQTADEVHKLLSRQLAHIQQPSEATKAEMQSAQRPKSRNQRRRFKWIALAGVAIIAAVLLTTAVSVWSRLRDDQKIPKDPHAGDKPIPSEFVVAVSESSHPFGTVRIKGNGIDRAYSKKGIHKLSVPPGQYRVTIRSKYGYLTRAGTVSLAKNQTRRIVFHNQTEDRYPLLGEREPASELPCCDGNIRRFSFSPDGSMLATIARTPQSSKACLMLFKKQEGGWSRVALPEAFGQVQNDAAFDPEEARLAVATDAGVVLWDIANREVIDTLTTTYFRIITFSPDGNKLYCGKAPNDNSITVIDVETKKPRRVLLEHSEVNCLAVSPDGNLLASGHQDGEIVLWNTGDLTSVGELRGHMGYVFGLDFTSDSRRLASASSDASAKIWDVERQVPLYTLGRHQHWVFSVAFSPNDLLLVTTCCDHGVRVWNTENGSLVEEYQAGWGWINCVAFSPDGAKFATGGESGILRFWRVPELPREAPSADQARLKLVASRFNTNFVSMTDVTADGSLLAEPAAWEGDVLLWDLEKYRVTSKLECRNAQRGWSATNARFYANDSRLAVAGDGQLISWNLRGGKQFREGHPLEITLLRVSANSKAIVMFSRDSNSLCILDADDGKLLEQRYISREPLRSVQFLPDGSALVVATKDGALFRYDMNTGESVELPQAVSGLHTIEISKDGKQIATGLKNGRIVIWDFTTWEEVAAFQHDEGIHDLDFSPDGRLLACGSALGNKPPWSQSGHLIIWDLASQRKLVHHKSATGIVHQVKFFGENSLLTVSGWHHIKIWDVSELLKP